MGWAGIGFGLGGAERGVERWVERWVERSAEPGLVLGVDLGVDSGLDFGAVARAPLGLGSVEGAARVDGGAGAEVADAAGAGAACWASGVPQPVAVTAAPSASPSKATTGRDRSAIRLLCSGSATPTRRYILVKG